MKLCAVLLLCCLGLALPAAAQLDSGKLRAKFGGPLNRETFHLPAGFDLVVDYGGTGGVCRLQVPPLMPTTERVSNLDQMKQRMYEFLADLVPSAMRGKELNKRMAQMGVISVSTIEYEHVIVGEVHSASPPGAGDSITVTFKNSDCQSLTAH